MFRVAGLFLVVGWFVIQVAGTTFGPMGLPNGSMKLVIVLVVLSFVLACALAWTLRHLSARDRAYGAPRGHRSAPPVRRLPKHPWRSCRTPTLASCTTRIIFCDGLAEEILNALASISGMRVASRTSSFRFRDSDTDARDIGRALNVAAIMEGSVRKAGEHVRVTAQLVECRQRLPPVVGKFRSPARGHLRHPWRRSHAAWRAPCAYR